jgi:uncharacterized protein (TIGR03086 family)
MPTDPRLAVLSRALRQVAALLDEVRADDVDRPTPCRDWSVARLVDHLVADPTHFVSMLRGEQPDWTAGDPHVDGDPVAAFRTAADALVDEWSRQEESAVASADWQTAELAVHAWDLARALGRPTETLDEEAARRGLAFMRSNLSAENRGAAFDAEQPAPPDASIQDELAAFAGRAV